MELVVEVVVGLVVVWWDSVLDLGLRGLGGSVLGGRLDLVALLVDVEAGLLLRCVDTHGPTSHVLLAERLLDIAEEVARRLLTLGEFRLLLKLALLVVLAMEQRLTFLHGVLRILLGLLEVPLGRGLRRRDLRGHLVVDLAELLLQVARRHDLLGLLHGLLLGGNLLDEALRDQEMPAAGAKPLLVTLETRGHALPAGAILAAVLDRILVACHGHQRPRWALLCMPELPGLKQRPHHGLDHALDVEDWAMAPRAVRAHEVLVHVTLGIAGAVCELVKRRERILVLVAVVEDVVDGIEEALERRPMGVVRSLRRRPHVVPHLCQKRCGRARQSRCRQSAESWYVACHWRPPNTPSPPRSHWTHWRTPAPRGPATAA